MVERGEVEAAIAVIKAQRRGGRRTGTAQKPPTPPHKPPWKRTMLMTGGGEQGGDGGKGEEQLMKETQGGMGGEKKTGFEGGTSLLDVQLEDILQAPSFMQTHLPIDPSVPASTHIPSTTIAPVSTQTKVPPSGKKPRDTSDYHYTGHTIQGSTKGSSGLKSKIALRTVSGEEGELGGWQRTPVKKEKAG